MRRHFYVYIVTNKPYGTIYIGMTNDIARRAYEHRHKLYQGFTQRYGLGRLVLVEEYSNPNDAIAREKQLKNWRRDWKIDLANSVNPHWDDLYETLL